MRANRLTEKSRTLLTALSIFRWHRTKGEIVNSSRERYNGPRGWTNRIRRAKWPFTDRDSGMQKGSQRPSYQRLRHFTAMKNIYHRLLLLIAGSTQKQLASQIRYLRNRKPDPPLRATQSCPGDSAGAERAREVRGQARQTYQLMNAWHISDRDDELCCATPLLAVAICKG